MKTAVSSVASTMVDVASLAALIEVLGVPVGAAAFCAAAVGALVNFMATKFWAFSDRSPLAPRQVAAYALMAAGAAALVALCIHLLVNGAGVAYLLAKAIAAVLVFLVWSYPVQARFVFSKGGSYAY